MILFPPSELERASSIILVTARPMLPCVKWRGFRSAAGGVQNSNHDETLFITLLRLHHFHLLQIEASWKYQNVPRALTKGLLTRDIHGCACMQSAVSEPRTSAAWAVHAKVLIHHLLHETLPMAACLDDQHYAINHGTIFIDARFAIYIYMGTSILIEPMMIQRATLGMHVEKRIVTRMN
jgi:hypothetical protein